ncbi:MAG TPA: class I SAM-dependent methyltransferase [Rhizomicrobium sp.]|jgi:S-adenosylmethionine-diacylgycerolhomoserine-N-methlytransferase|nr:class I SAM-dependent methyltransferase [Rhizomicrobium sp.]
MYGADPHGALMNAVYRRQRHIYNFTRRYYLVGRDDLIHRLNLQPGDRAVEIGCGTARNLIAIARRYPGARLFGLDASSEMLQTAQEDVNRAGLAGRILLRHGFAEALSPELFGESPSFDSAIFSYSLSMIPDWRHALAAAGAALSDGGRLHIVDFGDFASMPRAAAAALRSWLRRFHVVPRGELLDALERAAPESGGELRLYPGRYAFCWSGKRSSAVF